MKKALALALVISMAFVGTMFAQATPDIGANPYAPGQQDPNPGHDDPDGKDGAPGQTGENQGNGSVKGGGGCVCWVGGRCCLLFCFCFLFQAEDGIRCLVRSRGLGDVYKRQDIG